MNVLFVCTHGVSRSATGEVIGISRGWNCRAAGTDLNALVRVSRNLVEWADKIYVMENLHQSLIESSFNPDCPIVNLHIDDIYDYMEDSLVEIIQERI